MPSLWSFMSEASARLADGTIFLFLLRSCIFSPHLLTGRRWILGGVKFSERGGVTAWSLNSGVREASSRLCSPRMGCQQEGGTTSCCKDDEEDMQHGRQRSDSYRASGSLPDCFPLCRAAYHAGSVCTHIFPPRLLMQGALF